MCRDYTRLCKIYLRPGELPANPDPLKFSKAVFAFDRVVGGAHSIPSWLATIQRWPDDHRPHLALGKKAYLEGDPDLAMTHYRRRLRVSPGHAVLEINLAAAMAEAGCAQAAETRLRGVYAQLEPESPWREDLRATLQQLEQSPRRDQPHCTATGP